MGRGVELRAVGSRVVDVLLAEGSNLAFNSLRFKHWFSQRN